MIKANVKSVEHAKPGRHQIDGVTGLYLHVGDNGARRWLFRYHRPDGRANETGLGGYGDPLLLAAACKRARELRAAVKSGRDPIAEKRELKRHEQQAVNGKTSFGDVTKQYAKAFATRAGTRVLVQLIDRHAADLMNRPIASVTTADIRDALDTVQAAHPKAARRALNGVSIVMGYAVANQLREGNPASWEIFKFLWPPLPPTEHYRSMPAKETPALFAKLLAKGTVSSLGLAFTIATAARQSETIGMKWDDLRLDERLWVVPADKIKMRREHRVPLSDAALDILNRARALNVRSDYVFPGLGGGRLSSRSLETAAHRQFDLPYAVHGFRATFSTFAHDMTDFDHETIEACLAHATGSAVSRAYNRGDQLEKRRALMEDWAKFLTG
jgi:integrase